MEYVLFVICVYCCVTCEITACSCRPGYRQNSLCNSDYVIEGEVIATERRPQNETNPDPWSEMYILSVGIIEEADVFKTHDSLNLFRSEPGSNYFSLLNLTTPIHSGLCGMADYFKINVPYYMSGQCNDIECEIHHCDWYMDWGYPNANTEYQRRTYLQMWTETCVKCEIEHKCEPDCPGDICPLFEHQGQMCVHHCTSGSFEFPQQCHWENLSIERCAADLNTSIDDMYITKTTESPELPITTEKSDSAIVDSDDTTISTSSIISLSMTPHNHPLYTTNQASTPSSTTTATSAIMSVFTPLTIGLIVAGVVVAIAIAVTVIMVTKNARERNKSYKNAKDSSVTYEDLAEHSTTEPRNVSGMQPWRTTQNQKQAIDPEYIEPVDHQYESPYVIPRPAYANTDQYAALDVDINN